jgi:hypothetical protein
MNVDQKQNRHAQRNAFSMIVQLRKKRKVTFVLHSILRDSSFPEKLTLNPFSQTYADLLLREMFLCEKDLLSDHSKLKSKQVRIIYKRLMFAQ